MSNDLVEPPTKNINQLPTPSRTESPDLPETIATLGGLQDDILDMIETSSNQLSSSPEPPNRATNIALRANKVSAKPSINLILLQGSKRIRRQAYAATLANLSTLAGYYAGFATGLVKDIN